MKCIRILPEAWASTLCPLANSTRNMALGKFSFTVPSTSIASFLAISSRGLSPPWDARRPKKIVYVRRDSYGNVSTSGSPSVIARVCSKCAERLPSNVRTVQLSMSRFVCQPPTFTMGSMAITMPGRRI